MAGIVESGLVRDPVCGMMIEPQDAVSQQGYDGQTYYFCNQSCARLFAAEPQSFLKRGTHSSRHSRGERRLLLPHAPRGPQPGTRELSQVRYGARACDRGSASNAHRVHLSDAPPNSAVRTGKLSYLWHGA